MCFLFSFHKYACFVSFKTSTLLWCVFADAMMICYRILLLFVVFSIVITMSNPLFDVIIKIIFKKLWFDMTLMRIFE